MLKISLMLNVRNIILVSFNYIRYNTWFHRTKKKNVFPYTKFDTSMIKINLFHESNFREHCTPSSFFCCTFRALDASDRLRAILSR